MVQTRKTQDLHLMPPYKVSLLIVALICPLWAGAGLAATVSKFAQKQNLIEVSGDGDELLGITAGDEVELTFGESALTGTVKKVLAGNRLHIVVSGDTAVVKKGAQVGVIRKENPLPITDTETGAAAANPTATIVKVGKNRIAVRADPRWDETLRQLKKGAKVKVFISNRPEPLLLMFDKAGKSGIEFLFQKKDRPAMVKGAELTRFQEEQTAASAAVAVIHRTPLPWFTDSGAAGLFSLNGMFFDLGYSYGDIATVYEVDKNSREEPEKYNGYHVGADVSLGTLRIGVEAGRASRSTTSRLEITTATLSLAAVTPYLNFGVDVASLSASAKDDSVRSEGAGLGYRLILGWSGAAFGISGIYQPSYESKIKTTYTDPDTGEDAELKFTAKASSAADLGIWVSPTAGLRLHLNLGNDFNDGGSKDDDGFENEEKILANERVAFILGGTWVGEAGFQFSAGLARNRAGLPTHELVYSRSAPSTGAFLGLAQAFGPLAVGTGMEYQKGGIVKENEEQGYDVTTTGQIRSFSLRLGLVL
jgi:hypothetical protein